MNALTVGSNDEVRGVKKDIVLEFDHAIGLGVEAGSTGINRDVSAGVGAARDRYFGRSVRHEVDAVQDGGKIACEVARARVGQSGGEVCQGVADGKMIAIQPPGCKI